MLSADLRQVVTLPPEEALDTLAYLERAAEAGDPWRAPIVNDPICRSLLWTLSQNYVLFAVLPSCGPARRILKYSYSEDFTGSVKPASTVGSAAPMAARGLASRPAHVHYRVPRRRTGRELSP